MFSAGQGVSSINARYSISIDMEEVLSNIRQGDFHIFVTDVVKSFDTVDRDTLGCALGRLGLPAWFRRVYFAFHSKSSSASNLPQNLALLVPEMVASTKDSLSMVFLVARSAPWCRNLESVKDAIHSEMQTIFNATHVTP